MQQATAPISAIEPELPEGLRFSIKSLLVLTVVCAVAVVIVDHLSIVGTVVLFITSGVASLILRREQAPGVKRFWLESIWGIIMPLACLATDPFVFKDMDVDVANPMEDFVTLSNLSGFAAASYGFILWQMTLLVASWFLTSQQVRWGAFLAGCLFAGAFFAGGIGIVLLPFAAFGSLLLIGLPGLTPLATASVFIKATMRSWAPAQSGDIGANHYLLVVLGFFCSVGVWAAIRVLWMAGNQ